MMRSGGKAIYAIDILSPEMNEVEKAYRHRDEKFERGEIGIILREEEHKKHVKEGTFPTVPITDKMVVETTTIVQNYNN